MAGGARFAQLRQLFDEVCDLAPEQRDAHLDASGASTDLVAEVRALVAAESSGGQRMVRPVAALFARMPETELDVGDRVGVWQLVEKLASGGMGAVYRAERADGHFQQQAAIKLLRGFPTEDALALLSSERQILAGLQHPHIARLLDGGATPGGQPYLVMEYVDGIAIDHWCEEKQLSLPARLRLFRNVCRAVAFAHQRLIVHCDLKPSNVLVRADGSPVLLDFGIARALDRARERDNDAFYYTPGYASPEQIEGAPVSVASDVYSLGLILFELVAGRKARRSAQDTTVAELTRGLRRPSELAGEQCRWRRQLRGDIDAIILRATAQHAGLRYASADALAEDIERHLDFKPVAARTPTLRYAAGRLLRRRWPLFAGGALIVLMAAGFSWRLVNERDRALLAEHNARLQADTAEQVSEFLISIFEFANPEKNPSRRDITTREMLEESTRKLDGTLEDKPSVRGRLLYVLAQAWDRLGHPRRSIELYRAGIAEWQRAGRAYDRHRAEGLGDLAIVQVNNNLDEDALASAREALALREAAQPRDELGLADAWNTMGVVLSGADSGRLVEAQTYLEQSMEVRRRANVSSQYSSMNNLANVYRKQGKLDEAVALYEETLAGKRRLYGTDLHPSIQASLSQYADALVDQGRMADAIAMQRQVMELQKRSEGAQSDSVAESHNRLGSLYQDAGDYTAAMQHYRESLELRRNASQTLPTRYAQPLNNLGVALFEIGDYAAAEPLQRESLQVRREALGADDLAVVRAEHNLARLLLRTGRAAEAGPLLEHALAIRRKRLDPRHVDLGRSELLRVEWLRREGRLEEAARALAELENGPLRMDRQFTAQREQERASLALARRMPQEAVAPLRKAYALMAEACGKQHPLTAAVAVELAMALHANALDTEARSLAAAHRGVVEQVFAEASAPRAQLREMAGLLR
jgi:eukaryotic-like serine/threonine-protein kinase